MLLKKFGIFLIQILFSVSAFSQIDSTFKDTNIEITIYEYDTVYLQSDTIRLTNIIVDTIGTNPIEEKKFNPFFSFFVPHSIGINANSFIAGNLKETNLSDTLSSMSVINYSIAVQLNYEYKKIAFTIAVGYSPFHEKCHFHNTYYTSNSGLGMSATYDSLLINKEYFVDYYYNYLNLNIFLGRKWTLNNKFSLGFNAGCFSDLLLGYKQGNTYTTKSEIKTFDISIAFSAYLSYKVKQNIELNLSPFYQHSLLENNKYPYTSFQKIGIGFGFNFIL